MAYSCDITQEPKHFPTTLATDYNFPLDPFQKHAISAIDQGHNVLVCAKTGSGKTLVGEYQIAHSLKQGKRVFYTTPIKSLSNQKFHDLKQMYPALGQVGIMTGDIKFCPDAQIVIMTTEILRNLLYKKGTKTEHLGLTASLSVQNLDAVIFDECHYINDKDRGKVWEETMILLDPSVKMVMLSATLDHPELFASWLADLKKNPCALIQTQYRIVPLNHSVLCDGKPLLLMDHKDLFHAQNYNTWLQWRQQQEKSQDAYKRQVKTARAGGHEGRVEGKVSVSSYKHQVNELLGSLASQEKLPAIFFFFSRAQCERLASEVIHDFLDSNDTALVNRIFDFHLRHHKTHLETIPQYHTLRTLLAKGIAFHHSGLLPVLKEVIEILFSKGLVKLLFATETFAVGINMPTKTVIFGQLSKYDDATQGLRLLRTDEYIQMAGRAGRRGKDTVGYVYYLPEREPPTLGEMQALMKGSKPRVESRMDFHYDFLLKTLATSPDKWLEILKSSYWFQQLTAIQEGLSKEREQVRDRLDILRRKLTEEEQKDLYKKRELEETIATTQNAKRREAQRALEQWKNQHLGPKWANAETIDKQIVSVGREFREVHETFHSNEQYTEIIERRIAFLQKAGYLEDNRLTTKGIVATEFNEGHPFLCAELLTEELCKGLNAEEIVLVLCAFLEDPTKDESPSLNALKVSPAVKETLHKLNQIAQRLAKEELETVLCNSPDYWNLSTGSMEPIAEWLAGGHLGEIAQRFGIFEGNFVRMILKVMNLVEEWTAGATYLEQIEMLTLLEGIKDRLVKEAVIPDSLYLHL